ncbi:TPA: hypothetical protein ACXNPR_004111 [Enterobacter cancerogenus]
MRPLPAYPPYRSARTPNNKRWLSACALLVLLASGGMAMLHPAGASSGRVIWGMVGAVMLTGGLWLIRQLYYRLSVHNAQLYERLVERQRQEWWTRHQRFFALSEWVLLGPAGANSANWHRLLRREHRPPEVKNEASGKALRVVMTMVDHAEGREAQLAKMLVLQWQLQRVDSPIPPIAHCYWQGSTVAWKAFCAQMQATFPQALLPEKPHEWRGEESLSALVEATRSLSGDEAILVAGCHSAVASFHAELPAGESAALWLVGQNGPVCMTRGEFYDSADAETLADVCERAERQSELEEPPEACMLFSHPALPALAQSGWNVTHHLQDLNWGDPGEMELLIVLTLAAISANYSKEPCGWIAKDTLHTLAFGIVKPYGQGK